VSTWWTKITEELGLATGSSVLATVAGADSLTSLPPMMRADNSVNLSSDFIGIVDNCGCKGNGKLEFVQKIRLKGQKPRLNEAVTG
jgi:hypothetical protein